MTNKRNEPWERVSIDVSMERVRRVLSAHLPEDHVAHSDWHMVRNAVLGVEPIICGCGDHITAHDPGVCGTCADILRMSARDGWRLASDPPEDDRNVIVWYTPNDPTKGAPGGLFSGFYRDGEWWPYSGSETVTHWRDVTPPTEGNP